MTDEGKEKMGAEDLDTAFAQAAASYQAESARIEEGPDIMGTLANSTGDTNTKQITSTPENDEIAKWEAEFTMLMEQQASSFQPDIPEQWDGPVGFSGDGVPSFGDYVFGPSFLPPVQRSTSLSCENRGGQPIPDRNIRNETLGTSENSFEPRWFVVRSCPDVRSSDSERGIGRGRIRSLDPPGRGPEHG